MSTTKKEPALLVDGCHGIYVPQNFIGRIDPAAWGISAEDAFVLADGPDHVHYWDTWDFVLNGAEYTDADGVRWYLSQDGDLFAYPSTWDHDRDCHELTDADLIACEDCMAYCEYGIESDDPDFVAPFADDRRRFDWSDVVVNDPPAGCWDSFGASSCDCCGSTLGGSRHRLTRVVVNKGAV